MNEDTRRLLKVFGVAVTDAEAEVENLVAAAAQLSASSGTEEIVTLLKNASDLCRELNNRWQEITQRVFAMQDRLLTQVGQAAAKVQGTQSP